MNELCLSVLSSDDVDEIYASEQVESVDIAKGQATSFDLTDEQALKLYHFIRNCLLLGNKVNITVADQDGILGNADKIVDLKDGEGND